MTKKTSELETKISHRETGLWIHTSQRSSILWINNGKYEIQNERKRKENREGKRKEKKNKRKEVKRK